VTELLKQATRLLAREATRMSSHAGDTQPTATFRSLPARPNTAALERRPAAQMVDRSSDSEANLRRQVYEIIGSLLSLVGERPDNAPSSVASEFSSSLPRPFRPVSASTRVSAPKQEQVPLIHCDSIVPAGGTAQARLRMSNQSDSPCPATLYCSNFVTDTGYEIPSVRVSMSPRHLVLPARGASDFEIAVAVPEQTPAGCYAGLIRAMGSRDFQVVLSVEVS
jgi:hypothetical protein